MANILNVSFHGLHYLRYKFSTFFCNVLIIYYNRHNRNGGFYITLSCYVSIVKFFFGLGPHLTQSYQLRRSIVTRGVCPSFVRFQLKLLSFDSFCENLYTKFRENPSGGSRAVSWGETDGQTEKQWGLGVAFRKCFANVSKKGGIWRLNGRRKEGRPNKEEEKNSRE